VERARQNRARGGGRSSGVVGFNATVHGRKSWWWLRVPGAALSMVRRSDACLHGRSHDGDMAGGEELSGAVETAATGAKRARELGGKEEELTAESERGSAGSGRSWRRRIRPEMARVPEVEDEGEGGDAGPPAMRGSVGRTRESRRS